MAVPTNHVPTRKRVLVVDDDPSIRLLCVKTLEKAGHAVLQAEGSSEAMALYTAQGQTIDLLIIDLFLPPPDFELRKGDNPYPRVNGHELLCQALSVKKDLRVLFISSHSYPSLAPQGIHVRQEQFLQKPFSADALVNRAAVALEAPGMRQQEDAFPPSKDVQWVG